jgi:tight adherence protein B
MRLGLRIRIVGALLALTALCASAASAATEDGLELRPTRAVLFPDRAYVLSLPTGAYLSPSSVVVRENGKVVNGVTVVPASSAKTGQFGTVLVIDASDSMRGDAIAAATAAARAFADHRQPNQSIAVVTFNDRANVILPLTTDSDAIDAALVTQPPLAHETHLYDAVVMAVGMLEKADVTVRSVVVLSDGADTKSAHSLDEAAKAAQDAGVRIFTVGLRSRAFDQGALKDLARQGSGEFQEAQTPDDLQPIFDQLGSQLASEYLIRYRSNVPANKKVVVAVTVEGYEGVATAGYTTPAVLGTPQAPFSRSDIERFIRSATGMLTTAFLVAFLIALSLHLLIRPRDGGVRARLAEFVSLPLRDRQAAPPEERELLYERAEKSFEGMRWWERFKQELDIGKITISPVRILVWTSALTLLAIYLLSLVGGPVFALLGFSVPFIVRGMIRRRAEKQRQLFADQLPDNLQVLASALRAGHSLVGALSVVVEDSPEPSRSEFRRVIADEQLGVPLEDAFDTVAQRMRSKDLGQVGLVAALQHQTGGNTAEVLDRVAETVRERFEVRRLVRTLTTQGRMSRWILTGLPVFLLVVISFLNPDYIQPLYDKTGGRVLLLVAALMVTTGSLVIRKIVDIKV